MTQYSTSDLSRKSGDIIADAMHAPVMITQRKKPRLVLMSIDAFEQLTKQYAGSQRAYHSSEMTDEMFEEANTALKLFELEGKLE